MTVDRSRLPVPGKTPPFHFPEIERSTLASGLRVWTVRHVSIPVATVMLLIRRGAADDPPGKEGLAAITADMLDEGTGKLSSIELHEALARIGAQLDSDIGPDATLFTVTVLSRFMRPAVSLLADIVVRPSMHEADFSRVRQLRLHRLMQLRDMPGAVADRAFMRLLYGQHPYGHTPLGSELSLSSLTVDDVRAYHAGYIRPADATLVVAGDCDHADVEAVADDVFAGLERRGDNSAASGAHAARPAATELRPPPWCTSIRVAHRTRGGGEKYAGLPRAGRREHGARRPVRQPDQPEPPRGEGIHLRRADVVRLPQTARVRSRCR